MEMIKTKTTSLYMLFLKYLAAFFLFTLALITVLFVAFSIGMNSGFILPANYSEQMIKQMETQIAKSETFDSSMIPYPCNYVLLDENGNVLSTDMSPKAAQKVQDAYTKSTSYSMKQYVWIQRKDSSCIISYDMYAHFSSPFLNKWLPNPEILEGILFFIGFFLIAIMIAVSFGQRLKEELNPIIDATNAIKKQDLPFEIKSTKIREFNTVLDSIKDMSAALEDSLKQQWNLEQYRKLQISAIAHDIKTPLTIIKGNTELLMESEPELEDKVLLEYIHKSSNKIESYLGLLMEATQAETEKNLKIVQFSVQECIQEIESLAKAYCLTKNISLVTMKENIPPVFDGDREQIIRAVSNILDNAVEHTPMKESIIFHIFGDKDTLNFEIIDCGNGFSQHSLKYATQQFYTEKEERSGKHYGLGLFIAKSVAKKHDGKLLLSNNPNNKGAIVTLSLKNQSVTNKIL